MEKNSEISRKMNTQLDKINDDMNDIRLILKAGNIMASDDDVVHARIWRAAEDIDKLHQLDITLMDENSIRKIEVLQTLIEEGNLSLNLRLNRALKAMQKFEKLDNHIKNVQKAVMKLMKDSHTEREKEMEMTEKPQLDEEKEMKIDRKLDKLIDGIFEIRFILKNQNNMSAENLAQGFENRLSDDDFHMENINSRLCRALYDIHKLQQLDSNLICMDKDKMRKIEILHKMLEEANVSLKLRVDRGMEIIDTMLQLESQIENLGKGVMIVKKELQTAKQKEVKENPKNSEMEKQKEVTTEINEAEMKANQDKKKETSKFLKHVAIGVGAALGTGLLIAGGILIWKAFAK
ncbi:uncharacterized protein LOC129354274 [Poeciliopsis prolifica]|uniref:uncharacterized protein LOC129354274 n=1 Tax=Poeciliopsis prolifica TaxID=188132 RepID=UPI002413A96A|nr:uncharacterized protein LOC129354274 [Poeciliopsis prolifica]